MERYIHDVSIAIESILSNKLKSLLTALGIIFGVAAVISMLAIGNGAQQEILEQIKLVGVNNIVINSIFEENTSEGGEETTKQNKYSPGLRLSDADAITKALPTVNKLSPVIETNSFIIRHGKRRTTKLLGVAPEYFDLLNLEFDKGGRFSRYQSEHGLPVCVIGAKIKAKFFNKSNPVGKYVKCGNVWLKVIGVIKNRFISETTSSKMGVSNLNDKIYIPTKTLLLRYKNRSLVNTNIAKGNDKGERENYNQLNKIIVQITETELLPTSTEIITRMLSRRHLNVDDFEVTVPEDQLKLQEKTKNLFNLVLAAIAGISLVVGGIGIMNIMLASVTERIKEIGTRMAIGATKKDIIVQFLSEALLISISGGLLGIVVGIMISELISWGAEIFTIVSPSSVIIAFGVSVSVGVIFGYLPAKKASEQDPVVSLRN